MIIFLSRLNLRREEEKNRYSLLIYTVKHLLVRIKNTSTYTPIRGTSNFIRNMNQYLEVSMEALLSLSVQCFTEGYTFTSIYGTFSDWNLKREADPLIISVSWQNLKRRRRKIRQFLDL